LAPAWARVSFGGIVKEVCLAYLPEIAVGDYTIVHVGFAIAKLDEASAHADSPCLPRDGPTRRRVRRACCGSGRDAMKYLDEFRDGELAQKLAREIRQTATRTVVT
jgi:hypothetical protein